MKEIFIYNDEFIFLGRTALHYASSNGNLDLAQFLISKNVSLVEKDKYGKNIWFLHKDLIFFYFYVSIITMRNKFQ